MLENYIVMKLPRNPLHDGTVQLITETLFRTVPPGWDLRSQSAVVLSDSQPEPDLAVVREDPDDYTTRHPTPADVGLIIEVADSPGSRRRRCWIYLPTRAVIDGL